MSRTLTPGELERQLSDRLAIIDQDLAFHSAGARGTRRNPPRTSRPRVRRARRLGLAVLATSALGVFAVAGVLAVHNTGLFELDGDSVSHNASAPLGPAEDWNDVFAGTDTAAVTTGIIPDEFGDSKTDDQFTLGSKDTLDVSAWHWKSGVPPSDKTDLENAYAALYDDNGTIYLYLGADRNAVNGNAKLGFWIFQDHIGLNGDGTFSGVHKVGDLLIESAFTDGGTNLGNINVWQWEGADGAAGHLSAAPVTVGADCRATLDPDDFVCSINNDSEITVDWDYQGKKLGSDTPDPSHIFAGGFNETGVNLSHYFPNGIPCFSNVLAETRAAGSSVSSSTEDFVLGTFQTCGEVDGHKYLDVNGNGALDSGEPGLEGWTINLFESDGTTLVDTADTDSNGDVTFTDIEPGDYVVCEENQTGWTNTDPGGSTLCKNITIDIGETETVNFGNGAPAIDVTKEADSTTVCENGTVTYTYTVTNTGNVDLSNVVVTDDLLGAIGGPITLAAGADATFTKSSGPISGEVTNTATAHGDWGGQTPAATATAQETVTSDTCTVSVTKSADDDTVCTGGSTTYDFSITNNSASFSWTGTFSDDVVGDIGTQPLTLAPGETKTFNNVAGPPLSTDTTNTVTADGAFDDPDATAAGDTATDDVTVDDCTISVTKSADDHAICTGGSTTYDFTITNNSAGFSWTGTFVDDVLGDIGTQPLTLAPGETKTFDNVAGPPLSVDTTNTVTAAGAFDDPDATTAGDFASDTVTVDDCTVTVTKSADDHDICTGGSTTYDFSITNNSSFTWTGTLIDDVVGDIGGGTFSVDPGQTKTFNDVAGPALSTDTTNTVTATGAFDDPDATAAGDTATDTVNVHDCTISLTKTPSQTDVCNGTTVTYTYVITNNSDEFTWTGDLTDDQLGTIATGITIGPGLTDTETKDAVINGAVHNIASADGAFDDPDATAASDTAEADVNGHPCGQGCTPGFWQGGVGVDMWDEVNDPDWVDAGAAGTNPFVTTDLFSSGPWGPSGIASIDSKTMLELVGTGGGSSWPKKAARDLIAAYLNASALGSGYSVDTATILSDWADAVAGSTAGFQAFHTKYSAFNELGCPFGNSAPAALVSTSDGPTLGLLVAMLSVLVLLVAVPGWGRARRSKA